MNVWQAARQVRYLLQQATWEDGSTPVFASSSVIISAAPTEEVFDESRMPVALVVPTLARHDPDLAADFPELVRQELRVTVVTATFGDQIGEAAMVGAGRSGPNASGGRGLLEIGEKVRNALLRADEDNAIRLDLWAASAAGAQPGTSMGYVAFREFTFAATLTTSRSYPAALAMTATGGAGEVAFTFTLPATRFDTSHLVLRRATGSTAPATVTDGTGVTLGSDLPTSFTDTGLGAGTYSYALFMAYDEFEDGTNYRYSDPIVAEGVVVTAAALRTFFQSDFFAGGFFGGGYWRAA